MWKARATGRNPSLDLLKCRCSVHLQKTGESRREIDLGNDIGRSIVSLDAVIHVNAVEIFFMACDLGQVVEFDSIHGSGSRTENCMNHASERQRS